ncbi:hypothetical protein [Streptomyces sp. H27-C3]|uniref:hypothetical protein n=1 Tax=Streptomyces sp. H27-C3 TaxID=3046305 RepID=UPI0024B8ABC4|nr:hypothetical protein [Streptomyces sp. H27-C3]MDJ0464389.1 hypothetical protein [Streptomyces sp. H27-C3]
MTADLPVPALYFGGPELAEDALIEWAAAKVVEWGQMGSLDAAPLVGFRKTAGVAVAKLH